MARSRFGMLPVAIAAAALLLTVKVGELADALDVGVAPAGAEESAGEGHDAEAPEPASAEAGHDGGAAVPGLSAEPPATDVAALTPGDLALFEDLAARRAELDRRARDLETRESELAVAEQKIAQRIAALKELQAQVEGVIRQYDEQQEAQMRSLVKIYENMKPKDAAPIFDQLDMPILLEVIERMKEARVAPVLALMSPERAKTVTQELAQRRTLPGQAAASAGPAAEAEAAAP